MPKRVPKKVHSQTSPEYGELIQFLGKKFDGLDKKFAQVNARLDQKVDKIDLEELLKSKADKSDIDRVMNVLDELMGKFDDQRTEQVMMRHDLDRHERWHKQTAEKIGLKLEP
jgi:hypothetical protein